MTLFAMVTAVAAEPAFSIPFDNLTFRLIRVIYLFYKPPQHTGVPMTLCCDGDRGHSKAPVPSRSALFAQLNG